MGTGQDVTERPILFSGPMVRAILSGHKTQTRRVFKGRDLNWWQSCGAELYFGMPVAETDNRDEIFIGCPYGIPGDRLWVRETWGVGGSRFSDPCLNYRSDGAQVPIHREGVGWRGPNGLIDGPRLLSIKDGWHPSIHMPRWASRITLEITDVRFERLQKITAADARAEGIVPQRLPDLSGNQWHWGDTTQDRCPDPVSAFKALWGCMRGPLSWHGNPWVWVIGFSKI